MRTPCDEAQIESVRATVPCAPKSEAWILAATILASSLAFIDSTVVNVALPALQEAFHANLVDVQWVVESYGLLLSALILVGGALGDLYGRRLLFVSGVAVFAAASAACGFAQSVHQLILWRAAQGIGAAFLVPGSLSIISAAFDERRRGRAIGTWSGFTAITTALGPVLGGWLIEHVSWRSVFFINLPLAAAVIAIAFWRVPESRSSEAKHVDWRGAALATFGLAGIVYGFLETSNLGWRDPAVYGTLAGGFVCLAAFPLVEARQRQPMVPLALFRSRAFSGANLLTLWLYAALGAFFFFLPLNLIQVQRYSATATGSAAIPLVLLMFLLSRWSGGLVSHYGARLPLTVGPLLASCGFALFAVPSVSAEYWRDFFFPFLLLGFGMAVTVPPLTTVAMSAIPQDHAGTASGVNNAVARVAGVLAIAVLGIVMVAAFGFRLERSLPHLGLTQAAIDYLHAHVTRLAGMDAPPGLSASTASALRSAIDHAFVFGFRIVMLICALLAAVSAAVAALLIPEK
ncbi:MAG TPA: MFS transporter [Candidatus Acidoferrales bacterium]|nr:MFS transporter [Candidatus Acidoferrales bacterium]